MIRRLGYLVCAVMLGCSSSNSAVESDAGGDGATNTVDDGSIGGDGGQGPDGNVTPGDDGASEASSNDDSGFDSGPLCGTLTDCEEAGCVDTTSSVDNCGACGKVCPGASNGGATCTASTCSIGCDTGFTDCSGTCANEQTDPKHCGSCTACPVPANGTATCASAKCGISCNAGYENCGGACVGPDDPAHCGASCTVCAGPASGNGSATCATGSCGIACNGGYFQCNGDCHSEANPPTDACVVTEQFGVFVSTTGSDVATGGTRAAPYATIGYALQNLKTVSRVYVCAGNYTSPVSVGSGAPGATVYGGFSCGGGTWTYAPATQTVKIQTGAGVIPLSITDVSSALTLENLEFDAANATTAGGSSIAGFIDASPLVKLQSVKLVAGTGMKGADGAPVPVTYPSAMMLQGGPASGDTSGPGCSITCPAGGATSGGAGGLGGAPLGGDATGGSPALGGGAGQTANQCLMGTGGPFPGTAAPSPATQGAGATTSGSLSGSNQWVPTSGGSGQPGGPGQGGGGGGGSATGAGGGGGCGGCGGAGAQGGGGGGASVALLVVGSASTITLNSCTLVATTAGGGGAGVAGQPGQTPGGFGGNPASGGCLGGRGGAGGNGGAGGGGAGGISVGVLYKGTVPTLTGTTATVPPTGALGGTGGGSGNGGIPGVSAVTLGL